MDKQKTPRSGPTPGKWTMDAWKRGDDPTGEIAILGQGEDEWIADVVVSGGVTPEQAEANARLISLAPELLAFAERFVSSLEGVRRSGLTAKKDFSDWDTFEFEAQSLLARVRA